MNLSLDFRRGPRLDGRVAVVTGAATGMGRAIVRAFAAAGARVAVNHLPAQAALAAEVVAEITADGGIAVALPADLRRRAEVEALVAAAEIALGPLDIWVNNAGLIDDRPFLQTDEADWDRLIEGDLKTVFLGCRAVLPGMAARGRGVILNTASDLGLLGRAEFSAYCAAKAGVIGLTKSLAREFAPHIRVNALAPGPVATAMLSPEAMSPAWIEKELDIPQHRFAAPEEIAATAVFLASDWAAFYTGQVLGPNGGSVMP